MQMSKFMVSRTCISQTVRRPSLVIGEKSPAKQNSAISKINKYSIGKSSIRLASVTTGLPFSLRETIKITVITTTRPV